MSLCGLKKKSYKDLSQSRPHSAASHTSYASGRGAKESKGKSIQRQPSTRSISKFTEDFYHGADDWPLSSNDSDAPYDINNIHPVYRDEPQLREPEQFLRRRRSSDIIWAREDQLSVILENLSETGSRRSHERKWDSEDLAEVLEFSARNNNTTTISAQPRIRGFKKTRFIDQDNIPEYESYAPEPLYRMSEKGSRNIDVPRPIAPPPRDLESIARIDGSLIFEHFTTNDAWELGSALRNRLLPIPTPVVINISLANQNQTLFHTCTHSGVMPDNDKWVARKRKTVLRWGCSTWYMHCKFNGDEFAFRDKYGLGNEAGEYAIHGGGVPIRVTGVEGVVAVVVVSGLKQDEDHAVVVEVIRELYY